MTQPTERLKHYSPLTEDAKIRPQDQLLGAPEIEAADIAAMVYLLEQPRPYNKIVRLPQAIVRGIVEGTTPRQYWFGDGISQFPANIAGATVSIGTLHHDGPGFYLIKTLRPGAVLHKPHFFLKAEEEPRLVHVESIDDNGTTKRGLARIIHELLFSKT